jgi:hypothetical protein
MLEAVTTDLVSTISLKRSTQNPQLSTAAGRLPHLCAATEIARLTSQLININAIPKNLEYENPVLIETSTQGVRAFNPTFQSGPF